MGRPKKPIQRRSCGVYCVQLHLDGKHVMRSLQTRDIEVAYPRADKAMEELEAAHKAKQQGVTRWRDSKQFTHLLDLADFVDIPTAAEGFTGQQERDEATGDYLDKNIQALAQTLYERKVPVSWSDLMSEVERIRRRKNLSPLSFVRSLDASVFPLLPKMTFAMARARARTASRKQKSSIADQASTSAFLSAVSLTSSVVTSADLDLL